MISKFLRLSVSTARNQKCYCRPFIALATRAKTRTGSKTCHSQPPIHLFHCLTTIFSFSFAFASSFLCLICSNSIEIINSTRNVFIFINKLLSLLHTHINMYTFFFIRVNLFSFLLYVLFSICCTSLTHHRTLLCAVHNALCYHSIL